MKPTKKESFEWLNLEEVDKIPKDRLIKAVVKTPKPTVHLNDPNYPIRLFAEAELMRNANLVGRPVGKNHEKFPIYGAYVVDSEWSKEDEQLEALLLVPPEYVKKVEADEIANVSIEYTWRDIKDLGAKGKEFIGLNINRVDLLEGKLKDKAGDPNAVVTLFEADEKKGTLLLEVVKPEKPKEGKEATEDMTEEQIKAKIAELAQRRAEIEKQLYPELKPEVELTDEQKVALQIQADIVWAEMEAWREKLVAEIVPEVASAVEKKESGDVAVDPEKLEAPPVEPPITPIEKKPEDYADEETCKLAGHYWFEGACHAQPDKPIETEITKANVEALTGAVVRLTKTVRDLKTKQPKLIADAIQEGKEEILKLVEAHIPNNFIVSKFNLGSKRLVEELKKILYEARKEE